jgi:hypothetical protein
MTIEAMKQALEALENTTPTGFNMERDKQFYAAITALRTAIAEAEKQEPVAYTTGHCKQKAQPGGCQLHNVHCGYPDCDRKAVATPPAAQQEPDAYGYAKRLAVAIWEQHYKDITPQWKPFDDLMGVLTQIDNMTSGLTAQRQLQYNKTEMNCFVQNLYDQKMCEGKRGHYETMFHVVHRAIEAAHGITGEKPDAA